MHIGTLGRWLFRFDTVGMAQDPHPSTLKVECAPMAHPQLISPTREGLIENGNLGQVKSRLFQNHTTNDDFFDAKSQRWIQIDNFSFENEANHFDKPASSISEDSTSASILDAQTLETGAFGVETGTEEAFEAVFKRNLRDSDSSTAIPPPPIKVPTPKGGSKFVRNPKPVRRSHSNVLKLVQRRSLEPSSKWNSSTNLKVNPINEEPSSILSSVQSRSEGSLDQIGNNHRFSHVQSKVKQYIEDVKNLPKTKRDEHPLSPARKSLSLSNLNQTNDSLRTKSQLQRMKAFISTSNLDDLQVVLKRNQEGPQGQGGDLMLPKFDKSRLDRLLDDLSDDSETIGGSEDGMDPEITLDVEEILRLALMERREKRETEHVLSQLQANYDSLQRKYAQAENKIDKLRFNNTSGCALAEFSEPIRTFNHDSAFTEANTSLLFGGTHPFASHPGSVISRDEADSTTREGQESTSKMSLMSHDNRFQNEVSHESGSTSEMSMIKRLKDIEEKTSDQTSQNPHFQALLKDVGEKLSDMEHQQRQGLEQQIDPIQKVRHWNEMHRDQSFSPTLPMDDIEKEGLGSPPAEFDSGYPGSDRSGKFFSLKGTPPQLHHVLSHVEERDESQPIAPNAQLHHPVKENLIRVHHLHSVTDLSSDERSMFDPATNTLSSSKQPVNLAQQIDDEILELRNFFEDHREEMLSMLHGDTDLIPMSLKQLNQKSQRLQSQPSKPNDPPESPSDSDAFDLERRRAFQKRRERSKQRRNLSVQSNYQPSSQPRFQIGQTVTSPIEPVPISSFFPDVQVKHGKQEPNCGEKIQLENKAHKSSKRSRKAKREMKSLLESLEQANQMASTLRRKSEEIIHILNNEIHQKQRTCCSMLATE
eukprot:TCALIF_11162-PA protein Name:"Protein of unknown function" AED:0.30 eAED:0.30 QI:205/0.5/0.6/1/0.75/0.8/5/30/873